MTSLSDRQISIIDGMVNVAPGAGVSLAHMPREAFRDDESLDSWPSVSMVEYLFKGAASERIARSDDPLYVREMMDRYGIERAGVVVTAQDAPEMIESLEAVGDRWFFTLRVNPHEGMKAVRSVDEIAGRYENVRAITFSPFASYPMIGPNSKECYPIYAKCIERGLPIWINVGIPGPRVPGWSQDPMLIDEVCWFFPELKVVMKHGGEPWVDLCVKLMLKWPNLYYATSAFAPKYFPKEIIHYANTRGSDKIIYAGYWPLLGFEDSFEQLDGLALRDHVWPKLLSENARTVFNLPPGSATS